MSEPTFKVDAAWCKRARESVAVGMEQLDRQRLEVNLKTEFWQGYLAAIGELEQHIQEEQ
jgi:hypothetical protein